MILVRTSAVPLGSEGTTRRMGLAGKGLGSRPLVAVRLGAAAAESEGLAAMHEEPQAIRIAAMNAADRA
jgi:hypothetical protein